MTVVVYASKNGSTKRYAKKRIGITFKQSIAASKIAS